MNRFHVAMLTAILLTGCGGKFGLTGAEAKQLKELDCHNITYLRNNPPFSSQAPLWDDAFPEKRKRLFELDRKVDAWLNKQPDSSKSERSDEYFAWRMQSPCKG